MTEKECGLAYCYLVVAGSRNRRQDQTSGGLEVVEAGMKLRGQVAVASLQEQAFRGKPMDLMSEGQMAGPVLKQESKQA